MFEMENKLMETDAIDLVSIYREMGEIYKNCEFIVEKFSPKNIILNCLGNLILAGASIELIDGDTNTINNEIITDLLGHMKTILQNFQSFNQS